MLLSFERPAFAGLVCLGFPTGEIDFGGASSRTLKTAQ